jgi:hypothetical protein
MSREVASHAPRAAATDDLTMRLDLAIMRRVEPWLESGVAQPPIERVLITLCLIWGICLALNPGLLSLPIFAPERAYVPVWSWATLSLSAATLELGGLALRGVGRPHWSLRWMGLSLMTAFWVGLVERYIAAGIWLAPWLWLNLVFAWLSFLNSARLFLHRPPAGGGGDAR